MARLKETYLNDIVPEMMKKFEYKTHIIEEIYKTKNLF